MVHKHIRVRYMFNTKDTFDYDISKYINYITCWWDNVFAYTREKDLHASIWTMRAAILPSVTSDGLVNIDI